MTQIDKKKLAIVESEFKQHPRGMKLSTFVWFFQTILDYDPPDQLEVIDGLVKLFNDIDINGDGDLQWAEFNQYIVDQVLAQNPIEDIVGESKRK